MHVSTAYCNCDKKEVTEIIYPPPYNPDDIIQLVRWFPEDILEKVCVMKSVLLLTILTIGCNLMLLLTNVLLQVKQITSFKVY